MFQAAAREELLLVARSAIFRRRFGHEVQDGLVPQTLLHFVPEPRVHGGFGVACLTLHGVLRPVRHGDPVLPLKEEGLHPHPAADLRHRSLTRMQAADALHHYQVDRRPVLLSKGFPRHVQRPLREAHEVTSACDGVMGRLQCEEEWRTSRQCRERRLAAGPPEIHLIEAALGAEGVSSIVGDAGPEGYAPQRMETALSHPQRTHMPYTTSALPNACTPRSASATSRTPTPLATIDHLALARPLASASRSFTTRSSRSMISFTARFNGLAGAYGRVRTLTPSPHSPRKGFPCHHSPPAAGAQWAAPRGRCFHFPILPRPATRP